MATTAPISRSEVSFNEQFEALTRFGPYPWQEKLFELFIHGEFKPNINLPTGSGKTSIIPIWLLAIAHQASQAQQLTIPRRLVWVVNRRVVVDQATEEAEQIRKKLADTSASPALDSVRESLRNLSLDREGSELIAISTLRGEKEDNREWSSDPSRPAIIVGTVDMIGSRLLFSGYGDSRYWRAQHAGLLGQDALIINDEAHLTPAFAKLIKTIESIQGETIKPFRTIRLSATHPETNCWPESLEADKEHPHFKKIYTAKKKLHIQTHPAAKIESAIIELATQKGAGRTIVFVTKPEQAQKLAAAIQQKGGPNAEKRVLTLTGTMRGFERDELVTRDEFRVFTAAERPNEDYWLVATSAGEVGVNISADQLITTADTLDHLLQRFGRLNRFGETEGSAYLLSNEKEKDPRKAAALEFLHKNLRGDEDSYDISPEALFGLKLNDDACEEPPLVAPLHPWHIDVWTQTSLGSHPSRPQVDPWLHGKQDDIPTVHVAWREDVESLVREDIDSEDLRQVLKKYRLLAHEQLQEPVSRILKHFEEMLKNATAKQKSTKVLLRRTDGKVDSVSFEVLATDKTVQRSLANCQLVLPPGCGELDNEIFVPCWGALEEPNELYRFDIAAMLPQLKNGKIPYERKRACYRAQGNDELGWKLRRIGNLHGESVDEGSTTTLNKPELNEFGTARGMRFLTMIYTSLPEQEEDDCEALVYFGPVREQETTEKVVYLDPGEKAKGHLADVACYASQVATALQLRPEMAEALVLAGRHHDCGKAVDVWQEAAGRRRDKERRWLEPPLAKPRQWFSGKKLRGFRHEFESLRRAVEEFGLAELNHEARDLAFHLIASHHGRSRPCFEEKAYGRDTDRESSANLALECTHRFARLQRCYGPWVLAYLEAVFQSADVMASRDEEGFADE
jgi:CRISPR-associated endonuclease/helicase Cas3